MTMPTMLMQRAHDEAVGDERLEEELAKHKLALDIAGKTQALLEMLAESATDESGPDSERGRRPKR